LARGMSEDFWTAFVDPDPRKPDKRVLTVWGQGKINVNSANAQTIYGIVCANAPEHPMCPSSPSFDPAQAGSFISLVDMVRSFTGGAPLFGSVNDFIQTMQGQGMIGPMLTSFGGFTPVQQFKGDVKKQITTESKMFSIYAEGVVPSRTNERETRVSIQAVIDFRNATDLFKDQGQPPQPNQPNQPTTPAPPNQPPGKGLAQQQQMQTGADGTVVYYRIQ